MDLDTLGFFLYMDEQEKKEKALEQKDGNREPIEKDQNTDDKSRD